MHDYRRFSPLLDAEKKQIMASKHVYTTEASTPGEKGEAHEMITANAVNYILVHGKWRRIAGGTGLPIRQEEELDTGVGKRHLSIRFEYGNIRAPAVAQ